MTLNSLRILKTIYEYVMLVSAHPISFRVFEIYIRAMGEYENEQKFKIIPEIFFLLN